MKLKFDIHTHTNRHSPCSLISPEELIEYAILAGLNGVVITEHHYQWSDDELREIVKSSHINGLILYSGVEITTNCGDLLVFGLPDDVVSEITYHIDIEDMLDLVAQYEAFCVAAHPTRAWNPFCKDLESLPIPAMEVRSVNMNVVEQEEALLWANRLGRIPIQASDAHQPHQVGKYWIEIDFIPKNKIEFIQGLKQKRFTIK